MAQSRRRGLAHLAVAAVVVLGMVCVMVPEPVSASCVGPKEGGRWWNKNAAENPISLEVTMDSCGDQVLNGVQTSTRYGLKVFTKLSSGQLYQRPKVQASYESSNGKRWLYGKVYVGGYMDHMWLNHRIANGQPELYVYIRHESLDSKPDGVSKFYFRR